MYIMRLNNFVNLPFFCVDDAKPKKSVHQTIEPRKNVAIIDEPLDVINHVLHFGI